MKIFVMAGGALLLTASALLAQAKDDVIELKTGQKVEGRVTRVLGSDLEIQSRTSGGALATQRFPVENIQEVTFAEGQKTIDELSKFTTASIPSLLRTWEQQKALLSIPKSPAGAIGLRCATLLLETGKASDARVAKGILDAILADDWDKARQDRAAALVIEALRKIGNRDETLAAARAYLESNASAHGKAEVSFTLAMALSEDYAAFIEENPRWKLDRLMRPKQEKLYGEILDLYLAPFLRYEAPSDTAPKSLLAMAEFLKQYGDLNEAEAVASDVVEIFPDSPEVPKAKAFLESNP